MTAVIDKLDTSERAMLVHRVGHQSVLRNISIVPDAPLVGGCYLCARMNFCFLGTNHAPTTFGLDTAIGGFRAGASKTQGIAMRHLEKPVRCRYRAYFNRLE